MVGNIEYFVASATDNRNYYTHFGERLEDRKLEPHALVCLVDVLSILLESCILDEVGVPINEHYNLFNSYSNYQRARHGSKTLIKALEDIYSVN